MGNIIKPDKEKISVVVEPALQGSLATTLSTASPTTSTSNTTSAGDIPIKNLHKSSIIVLTDTLETKKDGKDRVKSEAKEEDEEERLLNVGIDSETCESDVDESILDMADEDIIKKNKEKKDIPAGVKSEDSQGSDASMAESSPHGKLKKV